MSFKSKKYEYFLFICKCNKQSNLDISSDFLLVAAFIYFNNMQERYSGILIQSECLQIVFE